MVEDLLKKFRKEERERRPNLHRWVEEIWRPEGPQDGREPMWHTIGRTVSRRRGLRRRRR